MADLEPKNRGPKACITCAKAKARCIPGPSAAKCERCDRLNKPCASQTPAPPRAKKIQKTTRVAELEKRLNQLASQLNSSQRAAAAAAATRSPGSTRTPGSSCFDHLFPGDSRDPAAPVAPIQVSAPVEAGPITPGTSDGGDPESLRSTSLAVSIWPSPTEAAAMLEDFRNLKANLFPFVVVPPDMSEGQLRAQRPFLWKGIMVVERFLEGTGQMTAGRELLAEISRATFVEPQKSLDVLHGLQLVIAWVHYCLNGFQLTNMLFLCRSLCVALRLSNDAAGPHDSAALERMRAFAGSYFLNSLIFTTEKLPDAFTNTSYLDTCCSVLEQRMEYETDMDLVYMIRIQKLAQSIAHAWDINTTSLQSTHLPPTMIIQAFQGQLDEFRSSVPLRLQDNAAIKTRVIIAEILLYEIALQESPAMTHPERLSLLWRCMQSVSAYMHLRFTNSDVRRPKFICIMAGDFIFAGQVALKLISLRTPGWDIGVVCQELALERWIAAQASELEEIVDIRSRSTWSAGLRAKGLSPPDVDVFQKLIVSLKGFGALFTKELEKGMPLTPPEDQSGPTVQLEAPMAPMDFEMWTFDDLHLTQFDYLEMDPFTPQWGY